MVFHLISNKYETTKWLANVSEKIHQYLLANTLDVSRRLNKLITSNGPIFLKVQRSGDLILQLAKIVAGQQLSTKAADSIWSRVELMINENDTTVSKLFVGKNSNILRSCGLSRNKIRAIIGMVASFKAKKLSKEALFEKEYTSLTQAITSLWGFGVWSSDMVAISFFGHEDVWPDKDLAIRKGIERLAENDFDKQQEILNVCSPYRTYLARHIWQGLDQKKI